MTVLPADQSDLVKFVLGPQLDQWLESARNGSEVSSTSSLAKDDALMLARPFSHLAWGGLVSAVDHLAAFRDVWLVAKASHPYADLTLLRSALLSASLSVHLLDDTPAVGRRGRCRRGALALVTELRDERTFLERAAFISAADDASSGRPERLAQVNAQLAQAEAAAERFGATKEQLRRGSLGTDAVRSAAGVVGRNDSEANASALGAALLTLWSQGSGAAHGRLWPYTYGAVPAEMVGIRLGVDNVVSILSGAVLVVNQAWRLWELRKEDHVSRIARAGAAAPYGRRPSSAFGLT